MLENCGSFISCFFFPSFQLSDVRCFPLSKTQNKIQQLLEVRTPWAGEGKIRHREECHILLDFCHVRLTPRAIFCINASIWIPILDQVQYFLEATYVVNCNKHTIFTEKRPSQPPQLPAHQQSFAFPRNVGGSLVAQGRFRRKIGCLNVVFLAYLFCSWQFCSPLTPLYSQLITTWELVTSTLR